MNVAAIVRKVHPKLTPYTCGIADLPIDELKKILGKDPVYKLSFNENPLGPSPKAMQAMSAAILDLNRYPDSAGDALRQSLAVREGIAPEQIILSNGADEMIILLAQTFLEPEDEAIIPRLSFIQYLAATNLMGAKPVFSEMTDDLGVDLEDILHRITPQTKMIFLCNPNNPTGKIIPRDELSSFLKEVPSNIVVVVDEAYHEYAVSSDYASSVSFIAERTNVVVVRTFSKIYSLAGARVGYGMGSKEMIQAVSATRPPFNVNGPAQAGALASLEDENHRQMAREVNECGKEILYTAFENLGLPYLHSDANFVFVDLQRDSEEVFNRLLNYGVVVRTLKGYGLNTQLRVSIGKEEEVRAFVQALTEILKPQG